MSISPVLIVSNFSNGNILRIYLVNLFTECKAKNTYHYRMDTNPYFGIDFRKTPKLYVVGKGEQGVLTAEPYKSEILPFWRFATPEKAEKSSNKVLNMFYEYKKQNDFVGMDMARKFLQMGYTRSRRYANHKGGKKYLGPVPAHKKGQSGAHGRPELPRSPIDASKALSAKIFYDKYTIAKNDDLYKELLSKQKATTK